MQYNSQSAVIVAQQLSLCPPPPRVFGPVEFRELCARLDRLNVLLVASVERDYVSRSVAHHRELRTRPMTTDEQEAFQQESRVALRATLARVLLGESLRAFCCHLAESAVLQRFCGLGDLERVEVPGHSQLQRYQYWLPADDLRAVVLGLVRQAAAANATECFGLAEALSLETVWVDTTCAETNIHYPVDWLLLRDAVRTIIQAICVLRDHGLKHRMPEPVSILSAMNQLAMRMSHAGKGAKGKKVRKAILREMTEQVETVMAHAERYCALVDALPAPMGWAVGSRRRMQAVLDQLPAALRQARERIIGERPVKNADKVLSFYEPDTAVITRGKAGAQVEFGHSLFITEQRDGVIVDWALPKSPQTDGDLLIAGIDRWRKEYDDAINTAVTDRGFDGPVPRKKLEQAGILNGMCPRSPRQLAERQQDPAFREQQRRRSQTEGRIAIVKQTFLGGRLHTKGHAHHETEVTWVVLAHNLWVLARLPTASEHALAA